MTRALVSSTICALLVSACEQFSHTVTITREQLQGVADAMVPADLQEKAGLPFPATMTAAEVILDEASNQIGLRIAFTAQPPAPPSPPAPPPRRPGLAPPFAPPGSGGPFEAGPIEGVISITGDIHFDGAKGAFYFTEPVVRELRAHGLPQAQSSPLSKAAGKLAGEYLARNPVYTLDNESLAARSAKAILKSVEVKSGTLQITVGL